MVVEVAEEEEATAEEIGGDGLQKGDGKETGALAAPVIWKGIMGEGGCCACG